MICKKAPNLQIRYFKEKNRKDLRLKQKRDLGLFCLLDNSDRHNKLIFFIRIYVVGLGKIVSLVIDRAILIGTDIGISFFRLSL